MQKADGKVLGVRLPGAVHEKLTDQAALEGATISDVARSIIQQHFQVATIQTKLDELNIPERFVSLFRQSRALAIELDVLAKHTLGHLKYDIWRTEVAERIDAENKRREGVKK